MSLLEELRHDARLRGRYKRSRFGLMLGGVIAVSGVLVAIAMSIYNSSGAAQLDVSGPRYVGVRDKVVQEKSSAAYPASGEFDQGAFDDFMKAYDEHAKAIEQVNGYDPAAVNNDLFNLVPGATEPASGQ